MLVTDEQKDALMELINIGFGRAAHSLSKITGERVHLKAPEVYLRPVSTLGDVFREKFTNDVATVHQVFSGMISGNAILALDIQGALALSKLLAEERVPLPRLDESDREVLTELGNILLNACLGTFSNLLKVHVTFSLPRIRVDSLEGLLRSLVVDSNELRHALVVVTSFHLRERNVEGYVMIVMGVTSMDLLIRVLDKWMREQS